VRPSIHQIDQVGRHRIGTHAQAPVGARRQCHDVVIDGAEPAQGEPDRAGAGEASQRVSPTRRSFRRWCRTCQLPCNHFQSALGLARAHPEGRAVDAAAVARVARNCRRSMCVILRRRPPSLRVRGIDHAEIGAQAKPHLW
jgi:hypothetical protein